MSLARFVLPVALALGAPCARAASFDDVAAKATRLDALEPFLSRFVGKCTDVYEKASCQRNVAAARKEVAGKTFAVRVPDSASIVRPTIEGDRFTLLFTPFVDGGGGYALTHGAPARQDAQGRPVVPLVPIKGKLPPGTLEMEFQGPFRSGAIELEIVFTPDKTWRLKRKGEPGDLEGVAARFLAVRVLDARSGKEIASRIF